MGVHSLHSTIQAGKFIEIYTTHPSHSSILRETTCNIFPAGTFESIVSCFSRGRWEMDEPFAGG